ncbi:DNA polymerase lambda [Ahaetulla prasina]|uniref:DNA polymerase lambda n=1 Tax=Ahaetulla prasina TaxID=499056 RepID=UPI00264997F4|nr:DNA polymerase lambda [Ahaetulla prasina]XP_058045359.1 DNA polymerase lambda [Ahaetulla prasina]XP_058045361.1 DNA polymerase lambda [Ahaetulla prasina]XP_058045362.1 DNA polymerase lambda [Ahaetulla prasina]XP_058045363.1 DNA polymerase lambda [Ahaetulla prasina]XP_058045364.1 DNA polymerase lambda [Ahaetulla prasina]XP_058045365.1 DNA polymerase lambda [Ahaetulla prasina]
MEPQGIVKAFRKRKKLRDEVHSTPLKIWKEETKNQQGWLEPITAYVLQAGIGQARAEIFCKQIIHNGGHICSQFSPDVTHVIVDEDMDFDRAFRLLKLKKLPQGLQLVKASWLSSCITAQQILDTTDYRLIVPEKYLDRTSFSVEYPPLLNEDKVHPKAENTVMELKKESNTEIRSFCDTVQRTLDDEEIEEDKAVVTLEELKALKSGQDLNILSEGSSACRSPGKWVCAQSSESKKINHNQCITEKLEVLAKAYSVQGDKWRGLGYTKAINALKSYHKPVTSYQEACKIPGIGKQMAEKIVEILESGHLRKLDHISDNVSVLELFSNIWGAGVKTSQMWYQQGFRTLDDIRTRASLTSQQVIGLKYYEDFLERMPRQEAAEIEQTVREAAQSIIPELMCIACGSFRRGKPTCGDVDVLVTHPDGHSHQGVFNKLLNILHKSGFLTDDLVNQEDNESQQKYLGVCRLPGRDRRHRRLDIIVVPYREFACALLYFTGSAHFNRSMRALAKTKDMSLSEHALCSGVVRGSDGLKTGSGIVLSTPTEKDVFAHLGLPYREPYERDW